MRVRKMGVLRTRISPKSGFANPISVVSAGPVESLEHIGDPSCDDDTDSWEVYLRRKIDLFPKTSVYHTLFIWGKKTDARVTVLNT